MDDSQNNYSKKQRQAIESTSFMIPLIYFYKILKTAN